MTYIGRAVSVACVLVFCGQLTLGHVRLTYPPARKYALDFLDNSRTPDACGMPRTGDGPVTQIVQGSTVNVIWHLGYAHNGGYKLEILDDYEKVVLNLTEGIFIGAENTTTQYHEVKLPATFTCTKCTLRLLRQATEWGATYLFRSCADITIRTAGNITEKCSGRGQYDTNTKKCTCTEKYAGSYCEGEDECRIDSDCGENGKCVDTKGYTFPIHQCFCKKGYFGEKCKKRSTIGAVVDKRYYVKKELRSGVYLYYRHLMSLQQVEFIMVANVKTYLSVGLRPRGYTAKCRSWPQITGYRLHSPGDAGLTQCSKPEPEGEAEAEPKGTKEPGAEPESSKEPATEPETSKEPTTEPETSKEPTTEPETSKEPTTEPETSKEPTTEPETSKEPTTEPETSKEPTTEPKTAKEPTTEPNSEPNSEPTEDYDRQRYTSIHGMDCTDIVVGMVNGNYHRIGDYYTRDRSTPRMDQFYGGEDDLYDVNGFEMGDDTYMMFRKNVRAKHRSDNNIECGETHVIWAHGRSDNDFYKSDHLKYHGGNRGTSYINFHDMSSIKEKSGIVGIKQPISVRLSSVAWTNDFKNTTSQKFQDLKNMINTGMSNFLKENMPGVKYALTGLREGSVIVDMELSADGRAYEADTFREVTTNRLQDEISDGKLGEVDIDPNYVIAPYPEIIEPTSKPESEPEAPEPEPEIMTWNEMYIMIGCIVICVVVIIIAIVVAKVYVKRKLSDQTQDRVALKQPHNGANTYSNAVFDTSSPTNQVAFTNSAYHSSGQPNIPRAAPPQYQPYVPPTNRGGRMY